MKAIVALVALFAAATAYAQPAPRHWAKGSAIRVWIDQKQVPPDGEALVEKAMKTWTTARSSPALSRA